MLGCYALFAVRVPVSWEYRLATMAAIAHIAAQSGISLIVLFLNYRL